MATKEELKQLEKKYGLTVIFYPGIVLSIMRMFGVGNVIIDLNKYLLMEESYINSANLKELEATFAHEKVHEKRIKDTLFGVLSWYFRYIFSKNFRFEEEAVAYATEIMFLNPQKSETKFKQHIEYFANLMAGATYKAFWESVGMCTIEEAKDKLRTLIVKAIKFNKID